MHERYSKTLSEAAVNWNGKGDCKPMAPIAVDWYPNSMAYYLPISKRNLRRQPALLPLHNFLVTETELVRAFFLSSFVQVNVS